MSLDLRFIPHAAQGQAIEFPIERPGDGTPQRGLAHSRRSHEQQDGTGDFAPQFTHSQELEYPFLDVFQPLVILIEDVFRAVQVQVIRTEAVPGQTGQPVQVVPSDRVFG